MKSEQLLEVLTEHLSAKTRHKNTHMFEVLTCHYLSIVASMMRAKVQYLGENLPMNQYTLILASSGTGKNMSVNILDDLIAEPFHNEFKLNIISKSLLHNLVKLSAKIAGETGIEANDIRTELETEFLNAGGIPFSFGSATLPAIRQYHRLCIMANAGSLNAVVDEIGGALQEFKDVFPAFLTLYDKGKLEQKLLKGSTQQKNAVNFTGEAPATLLMFGSQAALLDAGLTEKEFKAQLATGYARRLTCAMVDKRESSQFTPEELLERIYDTNNQKELEEIRQLFSNIADPSMYGKVVKVGRELELDVLRYQQECEDTAKDFSDYTELNGQQAELINRPYKAIKLAGLFAYIDNAPEVSMDHWQLANRIVAKSGQAFKAMLNSPKEWERLAMYLADTHAEVTYPQLLNDLPFMQNKVRKDLIDHAIAYGYSNNIIIESEVRNGIDFLKGSRIEKTDLKKILISCSRGITEGYKTYEKPFESLHQVVAAKDFHYACHGFKDGNRSGENANTHCNVFIADVDGTARIEDLQVFLSDYTYLYATTKSHTAESHRFRLLIPLSHKLKFDEDSFKEFMENIYNWLPIEVDTAAKDKARKYESSPGTYGYNVGKCLDATKFIPRTSKANAEKQQYLSSSSLSNLERWCIKNSDNNRNNKLFAYASALKDAGKSIEEIQSLVLTLNNKLPSPLKRAEIESTIFSSLKSKGRVA